MSIYSAVTGKTMEEIEAEFDGQGYGAFKPAVGEAVIECLRPIREEHRAHPQGQGLPGECHTRPVRKKASYVAKQNPAQGL